MRPWGHNYDILIDKCDDKELLQQHTLESNKYTTLKIYPISYANLMACSCCGKRIILSGWEGIAVYIPNETTNGEG